MKTKTTATIAAVAALTLSACSTPQTMTILNAGTKATPSVAAVTNAADRSTADALVGDWAVVSIDGQEVVSGAENYPYVTFADNVTEQGPVIDFFAYNGCNFTNGTLQLSGARVTRNGEFTQTMRMCPDAPYEVAMTQALNKMSTLLIERSANDTFLYLKNSDGETLMTLRKHNLEFLAGAWRVTMIGTDKVPEQADIMMVVDLENLTIHGNAGCNTVNGAVKVDMKVDNGLTFTDLRTTRMTCPYIEWETRFLQALGNVASAMPSGADKAVLNDAGHNTVITLRRLTRQELQ